MDPATGALAGGADPRRDGYVMGWWKEMVESRRRCSARMNVVLNDNLIECARRLTGIKTKREVIHDALRTFVLLREQVGIRRLRGKLHWEGNLAGLRESRHRRGM